MDNESMKDKGKVKDETPTSEEGMGSYEAEVPEEFQQKVHELTSKATHMHLDHMQNKISQRRDTLHKDEEKPGKVMSTVGGPSDLND